MTFKIINNEEDDKKLKELIGNNEMNYNLQDFLLPYEDKFASNKDFLEFDNEDDYMLYTSLPWIIKQDNLDHQKIKEKLDQLWSDDLIKCNKCSLLKEFKALPVGNLNAKYLVIGEAPGCKGEGTQNINPFKRSLVFTKTSQILRQMLKSYGIYYNCFFTNLVCCGIENNAKLDYQYYYPCMKDRIEKELRLLDRVDTIILLGNKVFEVFNKYFDLNLNKGKLNRVNILGKEYEIVSIFHPAFFTYKPCKNSVESYKRMLMNKLDESERALVYDIETDSLDVINGNLKIFVAYSYVTKENYFYTFQDKEKIRELLESHNILVSFNGLNFDNFFIKRFLEDDFIFFNKINIDYYKVISPYEKNRCQLIKTEKGQMRHCIKSFSLDEISKYLFNIEKKEIDYNIFKKDKWTEEELKIMKEYAEHDILMTKKVHDFAEDYFESFKILISKEDIRNKSYIIDRIGVLAYRAICHNCNLKFEFNDVTDRPSFQGGWFENSDIEEFRTNGNNRVIVLDIKSAYNHAQKMLNLFSPVNEDFQGKVFQGNELYPIKGRYNAQEQGVIEKKLTEWYKLRQELKANKDKREFAYKTILNVIFGITGNPSFKNVFIPNTPDNTTLFCRQTIKLIKSEFEKRGYIWLYTATDSVYLIQKNKDDEEVFRILKEIKEIIKVNVPFYHDTFDLELQDKIKYIRFFRDDKEELIANNYIYVTEDNEFKTVGMSFNHVNATRLSKIIVYDYLKDKIIKNLDSKFDFDYIKALTIKLLKEDISLIVKLIKVRDADSYKSTSCIEYHILQKYGKGSHELIANNIFGAGKNIKYCTINDIKEKKISINDLYLDNFFSEISYFIRDFHKIKRRDIDLYQQSLF